MRTRSSRPRTSACLRRTCRPCPRTSCGAATPTKPTVGSVSARWSADRDLQIGAPTSCPRRRRTPRAGGRLPPLQANIGSSARCRRVLSPEGPSGRGRGAPPDRPRTTPLRARGVRAIPALRDPGARLRARALRRLRTRSVGRVLLQESRYLPVLQCAAHARHGDAPYRAGAPARAGPALGSVAAALGTLGLGSGPEPNRSRSRCGAQDYLHASAAPRPPAGHPGRPLWCYFVRSEIGDSLNLNLHFHCGIPDLVFVTEGADVRFEALPAPTDAELDALLRKIARRLICQLRPPADAPEPDALDFLESAQHAALSDSQPARNDAPPKRK